MSAARVSSLLNSWETIRYELLKTRVCDLYLCIEGSALERHVDRLLRELTAKGLRYRPSFYLTDSWGCADGVPVIGVPFYLACKRLSRIEEEQTGEIEDDQTIMMLLRHEAGHAINYAHRLWNRPGWAETFGPFLMPYRDQYRPRPGSREFVRHIFSTPYGRTYAQKHPDEDFAETFAVWLTPRSGWRRRYRFWPAIRKLNYVDRLMRQVRGESPRCIGGRLVNPVEEMDTLLAEHYGQQTERFRATAQGYVDDKIREVFPPLRGNSSLPAHELLRRHRPGLLAQVARWSSLNEDEVSTILKKLEDRAEALHLVLRRCRAGAKLMEVTALATSLAMDFVYTGRVGG